MGAASYVRSLEDRLSDGIFEKSYAALDRPERDVVDALAEDLGDWLSSDSEVHEGCRPEDEYDQLVAELATAREDALDEAVELVRGEYRLASPAARPVVERIGRKLGELRDKIGATPT